MKTLKTKISLAALMITLIGAGFTNVNAADELYRPDKQTGVLISPDDCLKPNDIQCGLWYHENETVPFDIEQGEYQGM